MPDLCVLGQTGQQHETNLNVPTAGKPKKTPEDNDRAVLAAKIFVCLQISIRYLTPLFRYFDLCICQKLPQKKIGTARTKLIFNAE